MFHYVYLSTTDKKNHPHNYKLPVGDHAAPAGHKVTGLRAAGEFKLVEQLDIATLAALAQAFPLRTSKQKRRSAKA